MTTTWLVVSTWLDGRITQTVLRATDANDAFAGAAACWTEERQRKERLVVAVRTGPIESETPLRERYTVNAYDFLWGREVGAESA